MIIGVQSPPDGWSVVNVARPMFIRPAGASLGYLGERTCPQMISICLERRDAEGGVGSRRKGVADVDVFVE